MANNTLSNVAPGTQAFYDRNLLDRAIPADVHGRFGQNRPLKTRNGNQIKFRRYERLTSSVTPLVEGVTPSGSSLSVTDATATLAQYGDYVTITDMVDLTNQDPVLTEAGMVLGEQAGVTIDQVRRDVLTAGTTVIYNNATVRTDQNTVLTTVALRMAIRSLSRQDAKYQKEMIKASTGIGTKPIRPAYIGIVHPDTTAALEGLTGYIPVSEYSAAMSAEPNEVGSYRNIRFFESTNSKVFLAGGKAVGADGMISAGGTSNDVYATLIIGENAYGVCPLSGNALTNIVKPLGSAGSADPLDQRATSGWKAITTTKILNEAWMVRVEHTNLTTLT